MNNKEICIISGIANVPIKWTDIEGTNIDKIAINIDV